jgi:hypothetical protein
MYPKTLKLLSIFPFLLFSNYSWACSCGSTPSFKYNFESEYTDTVIFGKITGYLVVTNRVVEVVTSLKDAQKASYIQVEIKDVLKGTINETVVNIPRGSDLRCNRELTNLPIGSQWIFALHEMQVSFCGETLLKVDGSKIIDSNHIDKFTAEKQTMKLSDFYLMLGIPNPSFKRDWLKPAP